MKRMPFFGMLLLIPAVCMVLMVGCRTEEKGKKDEKVVEKTTEKEKTTPGKIETISAPTDGVVKGTVKFKGTPPTPMVDPEIAKNKEGPACLKGAMIDKQTQVWMVGSEGGVANVVISLAPPKGKKFDVTDALKEPFKKPVTVHQPFCAYHPHTIAVLSKVQPIVYTNEFDNSHNVKIDGGALNVNFDKVIPPKEKAEKSPFADTSEKVYDAVCSIHTFMNGKIAVFPHPYFAVTNEKGEFEIKNVPIDTELTVYLWHESMPSKAEQKKMTFKKGDNSPLELEISAK